MITPPTGSWLLVCPAKDSKSARKMTGALPFQAALQVAQAHGSAWTWDEKGGKLYVDPTAKEGTAKPGPSDKVPESLPVKHYYYQFDSTTDQGHRMCNTSTNAMWLKFEKPNALSDSANADDEYLARVRMYGDTTDHQAQLKALAHFGLRPKHVTNMTWEDVDAQLRSGHPVPIAIYHKGPISAPYGGHCMLVIGKVGNGYRIHDPAGELDLINGGYGLGGSGKGVIYSKANLDKRWRVGGEAWGYLL